LAGYQVDEGKEKLKNCHNKPCVWESLDFNFGWILANDSVIKRKACNLLVYFYSIFIKLIYVYIIGYTTL